MIIPGNLYLLTAPSGAGKTTLSHLLVDTMKNMQRSISYTTRLPRHGEVHGQDYFFVAKSVFDKMIENGDFLECSIVHGYSYGTPLEHVNKNLKSGIDVILAIDWQGARKIREKWKHCNLPGEVISIFILPPSLEILENRLRLRGDNEEIIKSRLEAAQIEVSHYAEFDYLIMNEWLEVAILDMQSIVRSTRLLCDTQILKYENVLNQWLN